MGCARDISIRCPVPGAVGFTPSQSGLDYLFRLESTVAKTRITNFIRGIPVGGRPFVGRRGAKRRKKHGISHGSFGTREEQRKYLQAGCIVAWRVGTLWQDGNVTHLSRVSSFVPPSIPYLLNCSFVPLSSLFLKAFP
jgi:hypothetical protein